MCILFITSSKIPALFGKSERCPFPAHLLPHFLGPGAPLRRAPELSTLQQGWDTHLRAPGSPPGSPMEGRGHVGDNRERQGRRTPAWKPGLAKEGMGVLSDSPQDDFILCQASPTSRPSPSSLILPHSSLQSPKDTQKLVTDTIPHDAAMGTTTQSPLGFKMVISHMSNLRWSFRP